MANDPTISSGIAISGGYNYERFDDGVSQAVDQVALGADGFPGINLTWNNPAQLDDASDLVDWALKGSVSIAGSATAKIDLAALLDEFGVDPDPAKVKVGIFAIIGAAQGLTPKTVRVGPLGSALAVDFGIDTNAAGLKFNHSRVLYDIGAGWTVPATGIVKLQNDATVTVNVAWWMKGTSK